MPGTKNNSNHRKSGAWPVMLKGDTSKVPAELTAQLENVRQNLLSDLGDSSQGVTIIIDLVIQKLTIVSLMSRYACQQKSIIDKEGNLINSLGKNFLGYANSIRLDLQAAYLMAGRQPEEGKDILNNYLDKKYGNKKTK